MASVARVLCTALATVLKIVTVVAVIALDKMMAMMAPAIEVLRLEFIVVYFELDLEEQFDFLDL